MYADTVKRDKSGRYQVKLPFSCTPAFGDSKGQAIRRFLSLEKKIQQTQSLAIDIRNLWRNEYLAPNHMEVVPEEDRHKPESECFYLPHHGVIREQTSTTKLRMVFDASAKSQSVQALNDCLHIGSKLQANIFYVLLRFRMYPTVINADIEKCTDRFMSLLKTQTFN